jgi:ABC-type polysaccharide/polyol phosphate transport system ATPase subunit
MATIRARGLGISFHFDRQQRVLTALRARLASSATETWGLRGTDLEIGPSEGVAVIGPTGSGKTTLLRAIAGVLEGDEGSIEVTGKVASLLSADAGTLGTLTGRENAMLLAVLAGLSRSEARGRMEAIRERSGLEDAFERPASSYSQGMLARLSFTAAMQARPAILALDEIHEAFDHHFRAVLERTARELLAAGGIVVAAGHDHDVLSRLCERAVLLDRGRVLADGPFGEVRRRYLDHETRAPTGPTPAAEGELAGLRGGGS